MLKVVVIPTIRDVVFLEAWREQLVDTVVIVVEDGPEKTVSVPKGIGKKVFHYCWRDIQADFGEDEWIIARRNSGVRNYGFWKAYAMGAEMVVTLDDDCYPTNDHLIEGHWSNLCWRAHEDSWQPTYPSEQWMYTRGFPYRIREKQEVVISHGLWSGALDLDGQTEVANGSLLAEKAYPSIRQKVGKGVYYPMCSMNLAFRGSVTPILFFPMMGKNQLENDWGYDRFDDIWAGVLSKKIADHLNLAVVNGSPFVEHRKKSIPLHNLAKEKAGLAMNEDFWRWVDAVALTQTTPAECYKELAEKIQFPQTDYFKQLSRAMCIWAELFI